MQHQQRDGHVLLSLFLFFFLFLLTSSRIICIFIPPYLYIGAGARVKMSGWTLRYAAVRGHQRAFTAAAQGVFTESDFNAA